MAEVISSRQARADLADILDYLSEEAGVKTARKYGELVRDIIRQLEALPESGSPRPRLGSATRLCVIDPYVLIYDYAPVDDTVVIPRILHGSRGITPRLMRSR